MWLSQNYGSLSKVIQENTKDQYLQICKDNVDHSSKGSDYGMCRLHT